MRKLIVAAGLGLLVSITAMAAPDQQTPEAKAYLDFSFGGAKETRQRLHYGLRLDHDRYFAPEGKALPPLMQLDLSRSGARALSVNGVNVLKPKFRLNQDDEYEDEEIEEDEGFFESIGNWFANLFGDDEEYEDEAYAGSDEPASSGETQAAEYEEEEEGYGVVDWGLVAIGLAGIGFVTAEILDGDEDRGPQGAVGMTPEGEACLIGEPFPECIPVCAPDEIPGVGGQCLPISGLPFTSSGEDRKHLAIRESPDHRAWLDSGTGHMGDLYVRE